MIEILVLNYLKDKLNVPVSMEELTESKYVTIEKVGSGCEDYLFNARISIQSYADSLYEAAELNNYVKNIMIGDGVNIYGIEEINEISQCSLNSDYNFTDVTTKKYRYQAVFDIVHY